MRKHFMTCICCLLATIAFAEKIPTVYVDAHGVMRWSDTRQEASFYGTNYTVPFAHAYRALDYLNIDHKKAIDRDVYHFARLGFNAYRIHIWDVEISDAQGNLTENEHLDLLDYLIAQLQKRGIRIVITAQTNFGNGYPEKNQSTNGYSYKYDKCSIHSNPEAIMAQERYIAALIRHMNPYTGHTYMDDPYIVGFEINNEPCHSGTKAETKNYIDRMIHALRQAGNKKPVFYNVSHNQEVVSAYYDTAIQGTTYQWYPIGLVAGHTRKGNFLPYVDAFDIPFSNLKSFDKKARLIYEFDPADIMYSYMYPAMVRTFRKAGFQWITQFAYDPIDMAFANTEYQTHYLNLAYTPGKAISMKIASEIAQTVQRGESFHPYPADTLFHDFHLSYSQDLSELNSAEKFFYSNNTHTQPAAPEQLEEIAGCGSSPLVEYEGTGAYFIDKLEDGVWRLELMPDAIVIKDPFAKPSLQKEVVTILKNAWNMTLHLPDLGNLFNARGINEGNNLTLKATNGCLHALQPGVYLLSREGSSKADKWRANSIWKNIRLNEYVAPLREKPTTYTVVHQPSLSATSGSTLMLEAQIVGPSEPDSVIVYTDKISFWNERNPYIKMNRIKGYTYKAVIPAEEMKEGVFRYNMVICRDGKQQTFPDGIPGSPLDWDHTASQYWETNVTAPGNAISLFSVTDTYSKLETYTIPEWSSIHRQICNDSPIEKASLLISFESKEERPVFFLKKWIKEEIDNRKEELQRAKYLCLHIKKYPEGLKAGFVTSDGYTYKATCLSIDSSDIIRLPLADLQQAATVLLPHAYPVFLDKYFRPTTPIPFQIEKVESLELSFDGKEIEIGNIWLE